MLKRSEAKNPGAPVSPAGAQKMLVVDQADAARLAPAPPPAPERVPPTPGSPVASVEGDEVTVCVGVGKYSPVQYNSFEHGPFLVRVRVQPGETHLDAATRGWAAAMAIAQATYPAAEQHFLENLRKLGLKVGA